MTYLLLKNIHVMLAAISVAGFVARWWWRPPGSGWSASRLVRAAPHVIDTVFLATGIALAAWLGQYPFVHPWMTAKLFGLIAYILLGSMAMKAPPRSLHARVSFVAALMCFAWIVSVARLKQPLGWLAWP